MDVYTHSGHLRRFAEQSFFYSWVKRVKIGSSGVVSISSDMTYNVLEVHFYVAISKCKVWHTKTSKLKMLVTNLFIDKMS